MLRAVVTGKVRSEPRQLSGTTNGRAWSFHIVELLDGDDNKVELVVGDKTPGGQFCHPGVVVEAACDVAIKLDRGNKVLGITAREIRALTDANGVAIKPAAVPPAPARAS